MHKSDIESAAPKGRINSTLRRFLDSESSAGLLLMATAAFAILVANSPLSDAYFSALKIYIGPLSVQHWINDALMAVFFLMVGLEIKREALDGQLSSWPRRVLPGIAAAGGMFVPALVYVAFNYNDLYALRGWAIPSATDIAFALGVLSLLGSRVPTSLKVFLAALAIIDDLGAVIVIALFYAGDLSYLHLGGAAAVTALLVGLNRARVKALSLYILLGLALWFLILQSGVHATIAGVILALTIPIKLTPGTPEITDERSPLHLLERSLHVPVAFFIVPVFGFANAGISFANIDVASFTDPLTLGVAGGLVIGKLVGVFGAVCLLVRLGFADLPAAASWGQVLGVSLLCGIGFTMSLFISLLAFEDPDFQNRVKLGILAGSLIAGTAGYLVLRFMSAREVHNTPADMPASNRT